MISIEIQIRFRNRGTALVNKSRSFEFERFESLEVDKKMLL